MCVKVIRRVRKKIIYKEERVSVCVCVREREREGFSAQRVLRSFRISRSSRKTGSKSFKISRCRRRRRREAKKKFFLHNSASDNNIKTLFPPPNICFCCAVVAIGVVAIVVVVRAFEPHSVYNSTTNG